MRTHFPIATLLGLLGTLCSIDALAQGTSRVSNSDRGYAEEGGGLVSHGAEGSGSPGAFGGIDRGAAEAAAAARGRASAKSAGLEPRIRSARKAESFPSPDAAVTALITALRAGDDARLTTIFGVESELISSGDPVADRALIERFLREYEAKHTLGGVETGMVTLSVGESDWPFSVPIVAGNQGYYFNSAAGVNEVVFRRIGRNELGAIGVCRGYVAAQQEYASIGHDGQAAGAYAQTLLSDEGKQNGLFWAAPKDGLRSPAGPLLAAAAAEGYSGTSVGRSTPYHGYLYRMLTAQGRNAPGGARSYIGADGRQTGGFALVAYPAEYERTGVMSFIVNQDGVVYEKDLGERTLDTVRKMQEFDPKGWRPVR